MKILDETSEPIGPSKETTDSKSSESKPADIIPTLENISSKPSESGN